MELNKIEKSKRPAKIVFISIVISIIVLLSGVMGMAMLASLTPPPPPPGRGKKRRTSLAG